MDCLKVDKKDFIEQLLRDNKINVVRNAVYRDDIDKAVNDEILNYIDDSELFELLDDSESLKLIVDNYALNKKSLDYIFEKYPNNKEYLPKVIEKYIDKLEIEHIEYIKDDKEVLSLIVKLEHRVSDDATMYLIEKGMMSVTTPRHKSLVVGKSLEGIDIYKMSLNEIIIASYDRKFTDEELSYVIEKIFACKLNLQKQGYMDSIIHSQVVPDEILYKIITEWEYNIKDCWVQRIFRHQKLDSIIDYILDNIKLTRECAKLIAENKYTSTEKLYRLYENYADIIMESKPVNLPVLDCHVHIYNCKR